MDEKTWALKGVMRLGSPSRQVPKEATPGEEKI